MRRRWFGAFALVVTVVAFAAGIAYSQRGGASSNTPRPIQAQPSQQFGDDADLMRRLERKKLAQRSR